MADSVFHKDFKSMPWWWEWWHPNTELSQDPPRKTDVLVVGAGYGGLSTALELGRSGVEVTVLERGAFGDGASTRNGGGVSGGTTLGKGFSGKGVKTDPEEWKKVMSRMLSDAADSLAQVETVIQREGIGLGTDQRTYNPGGWMRREQAASLLVRAFDLVRPEPEPEPEPEPTLDEPSSDPTETESTADDGSLDHVSESG